MTTGLLSLISVLLLILIFRSFQKKEEKSQDGFMLLQNQLNNLTESIDTRLSKSSDQSLKIVRDITERLTRLDETNKQVVSITEELQSLQDILKNPKQRGILGEYYLETLLKNVLPPSAYQMQYAFRDGTIVDAVVFVDKRMIPIDSKFSLENYTRYVEEKNQARKDELKKIFEDDLKKRIVETSKYIKPEEGTTDFAFMYIPHEAIYYDLISGTAGTNEENLMERSARKYKVYPVSQNTLYANLQIVMQGILRQKFMDEADKIKKNVEELGRHLSAYSEYHNKLGASLSTVVNHYTKSSSEFKKIDKDVIRITGDNLGLELEAVNKPTIEE